MIKSDARSGALLDSSRFRAVLGHFPTGVCVVTASDPAGPVGMTIQAFTALSLEPPLVLLCASHRSTSWPRIKAAGRLCVNVLAESQEAVARRYSVSGGDKFEGVRWEPAPISHAPILDGVLAWVDCTLDAIHQGGDHDIAVCEVTAMAAQPGASPLVFYKSGFQAVR